VLISCLPGKRESIIMLQPIYQYKFGFFPFDGSPFSKFLVRVDGCVTAKILVEISIRSNLLSSSFNVIF
jgi:hypothetical protein